MRPEMRANPVVVGSKTHVTLRTIRPPAVKTGNSGLRPEYRPMYLFAAGGDLCRGLTLSGEKKSSKVMAVYRRFMPEANCLFPARFCRTRAGARTAAPGLDLSSIQNKRLQTGRHSNLNDRANLCGAGIDPADRSCHP